MPVADPVVYRPLLDRVLMEEFGLQPLSAFSIVVEGQNDKDYVERSAALALTEHRVDILEIPSHLRDDGPSRMAICSPKARDGKNRGGAQRCVFLAEMLRPYWLMNLYRGIAFVLDHDEAGKKAKRDIDSLRVPGFWAVTLDPSQFPTLRVVGDTFIEDMVSMRLQREFFDSGGTTCEHCYQDGDLVQIRWRPQSKHNLCRHACCHGTCSDFVEILSLVQQIRSQWCLPNAPMPVALPLGV